MRIVWPIRDLPNRLPITLIAVFLLTIYLRLASRDNDGRRSTFDWSKSDHISAVKRSSNERFENAANLAPVNQDANATCSFHIFRDYLIQSNDTYLIGNGTWSRRVTNNPAVNLTRHRRPELTYKKASLTDIDALWRFQPDLCTLPHGAWLPKTALTTCLCRQNITYIVINGDSNAWRLFRASNKFLIGGGNPRGGGIRCDHVASFDAKRSGLAGPFEGGAYMPPEREQCSIVYRLIHWHLPPDYYRCWTTCPDGREIPLVVQYLPMTSEWTPIDEFLVAEKTGCRLSGTKHINETDNSRNSSTLSLSRRFASYQDFLYSEYYGNVNPKPDLVLHFSSSHEQSPLPEYAAKVESFAALLRSRQPDSRVKIRTVIISKPAEDVRLKPKKWQHVRYEPGNLTRLEWIRAANRILHSKMAPLFAAGRYDDVLLFPDVVTMMDPVMQELSVDGVHASSFWYRTLWSYIVQTISATQLH